MNKFILFVFVALTSISSNAQLTMNPGLDTTTLSSLLEGMGVDINNMVINCKDSAYGQFSGVSAIPIYNGIALSTGSITSMDTINTGGSMTEAWGLPGDIDLDVLLSSVPTYDACAIEFDAIPVGDTLFFNFAFGSEEYPEFVFSGFNDVFAIFISGSGFATPTNIAVLPNDTIVSIDNVNSVYNSGYFNDNSMATLPINWDGFTNNIQVETVVAPLTPYHFKIAIADAADMILNSGVFLEAFSFRSVSSITAVNEHKDFQYSIAPNPFTEQIKVNINIQKADVFIYDNFGRVVLCQQNITNGTVIDLNNLQAGTYYLKISDFKQMHTSKLIKTK